MGGYKRKMSFISLIYFIKKLIKGSFAGVQKFQGLRLKESIHSIKTDFTPKDVISNVGWDGILKFYFKIFKFLMKGYASPPIKYWIFLSNPQAQVRRPAPERYI